MSKSSNGSSSCSSCASFDDYLLSCLSRVVHLKLSAAPIPPPFPPPLLSSRSVAYFSKDMEVDSSAEATPAKTAAPAAPAKTAAPAEQGGEEEEDPSDELKAALAMSMQAKDAGVEGAVGPGLPANFKGTYELFAVVTHKGREADGGARRGVRDVQMMQHIYGCCCGGGLVTHIYIAAIVCVVCVVCELKCDGEILTEI